MARILTGIQSTGRPHLGNILGAILPGIALSNTPGNEAFFFIANLHTLTSVHDAAKIRESTAVTAAVWLACGFDTDRGYFYRQSDIPEVTELTWYLSCFFPISRLELAHSYKDKVASGKLGSVTSGLMFYPMLMAADILMYDADIVPVGKDQVQHIEFTRDVAERLNHELGKQVLVVPKAQVQEDVQVIPGIQKDDQGRFIKMSKTYGNTIDIFEPDKTLRKRIMQIQTDTLGVDDPKNPDTCLVYSLYKVIAPAEKVAEMREAYVKGGMGYGTAKQMLYEAILERFGEARERFDAYMADRERIDAQLEAGAQKARKVGTAVLERVREHLGYK